MRKHMKVSFIYLIFLTLFMGSYAIVDAQDNWSAVTASAKPAVVFVSHRDAAGKQTTGTGFLVSKDGYILTCAHVVAPSTIQQTKTKSIKDKIWVRTAAGITHEACRVYCDVKSDIALLDIPDGQYPYLDLCNLLPTQGDEVLVIGYPMGQAIGKEVSVTRGIVSALRFENSIFQLDAAINPGNSGGPVINRYGQVLGIAFAKIQGLEGMNFAISAATVPKVSYMRAVSSSQGDEALFGAVRLGKVEQVKRMIAKNPKLVQVKSLGDGSTLLHLAVNKGNIVMAKLLLENSADVNAKNSLGSTPLDIAVIMGYKSIARLLLENGADVNTKDLIGFTPLHTAAIVGDTDIAKFLIENGAEVDAKKSGGLSLSNTTPLHWAVYNGQTDTAKLLIERGADVNAKSSEDNSTPLHWAAVSWKTDMIKALLENGANVNTIESGGETILHLAASDGKTYIVKLLIESSANVNIRNIHGNTPLSVALKNKHGDTADLLRQHGAIE